MLTKIVILRNDHTLIKIDKQKLCFLVTRTLEILQLADQELTIAFESNTKLKLLKRDYLGIDETTDVLSFQSGEVNPETGNLFLGDIIISPKKARNQAKEKQIPLDLEILTLCIHGLLHLIGYDHSSKVEEKNMFKMQEKLIGDIYKL